VTDAVAAAEAEGATVLAGGKPPTLSRLGNDARVGNGYTAWKLQHRGCISKTTESLSTSKTRGWS